MTTTSHFLVTAAALLAACSGPSSVEDVRTLSEPLAQCPSGWVEGIDVFDGQGTIDWASVRAAGVGFAFIKATQGTYDTQSTFAANWAGARAAGVPRGAYHFFDPTEDGAAQAASFLAVAGAPAAGDLPPMIDVECPDGAPDCLSTGQSGQAPPASIRSRLDALLSAVESAAGVRPILYTFAAYFAASGVDAAGLEAYPLFLAAVGPAGRPAAGSCLAVPAPWKAAAFWQYSWTGSVAGIAGEVDLDRFLGDRSALAGLERAGGVGGGAPPGCP